MNNTRQFF